MYPFHFRQHTSRSTFSYVPTPTGQGCSVSSMQDSSQVLPVDLEKLGVAVISFFLLPLMYWVPLYVLNYSKFLEYPAVYSQNSPSTLQGTAGTPPQMLLVTPELLVKPQVISSGKHHQIS